MNVIKPRVGCASRYSLAYLRFFVDGLCLRLCLLCILIVAMCSCTKGTIGVVLSEYFDVCVNVRDSAPGIEMHESVDFDYGSIKFNNIIINVMIGNHPSTKLMDEKGKFLKLSRDLQLVYHDSVDDDIYFRVYGFMLDKRMGDQTVKMPVYVQLDVPNVAEARREVGAFGGRLGRCR